LRAKAEIPVLAAIFRGCWHFVGQSWRVARFVIICLAGKLPQCLSVRHVYICDDLMQRFHCTL